ncbi:MAG: hypothetical protein WB988_09615 [Candidatus Nitrosopolaris sp.]
MDHDIFRSIIKGLLSSCPVGYFAVMSSFLRGVTKVFSIDHWLARLDKTKALGTD